MSFEGRLRWKPAVSPCLRDSHNRDRLSADLKRLGLTVGDTVLVHSSLSRLGPVSGGAVEVVRALLDVIGPSGTLVAPTFTSNNSDPSRWERIGVEPAPPEQWPGLRERMPAFDPESTPAYRMGAVAEAMRTWPGAVRSAHPQTSFAAVGAAAGELMAVHPIDCHLGPGSPLGALARVSASTLLLGVSYAVCTAFHLAEYHSDIATESGYECVIQAGGERRWHLYRDVSLDDSDFERLGKAFESSAPGGCVRLGRVGDASSRLFPVSTAAEFARDWMASHRVPYREQRR